MVDRAGAAEGEGVTSICVVVTARPSWGKLQTICEALQQMPDVELQIVACASALLERYGRVVDVVRKAGFRVAEEVYSVVEGENLVTSAKDLGAIGTELASVYRRLAPHVIVVCADRHEVLGAAAAGAYQHIPVAHLQGGERTGSIDDRVRDAITALADYHFPCTELAKHRVYGLTGAWDRIWHFGCSAVDLAKRAQLEPPVTDAELGGTGPQLDLNHPFLLVLFHPVTNEADDAERQMTEVLEACAQVHLPRVVLWPGQDAGAEGISKAIRGARERKPELVWRTVRNLPPTRFLRLLTQAGVLAGNSSAGIRESAYLGVPVVNVGLRQFGRERAKNVVDVPVQAKKIWQAIEAQRAHGRYPSSGLYGTGEAGQKIAEVLRECAKGSRSGAVSLGA